MDSFTNAYSTQHQDLLNMPIIVMEELPSFNSINQTPITTNYTLSVAITQYIAKGTVLLQYNPLTFQLGNNNIDALTNNSINRLMNYMIFNGRGTLLYY